MRDSVSLRFKLNDSKYFLKKYNIFVNDVPLFGVAGKDISGKNVELNEKVELGMGNNKIEVTCINEKGVESYRALAFAEYGEQVKKDLYFIGFGVSDYRDNSLNLKYADKDVKDIATLFSKMGKYFENIHIKTYLNSEVTTASIKVAKVFLNNSKIDDTVILFIAGHGIYDRDKEATYYYLTYEADLRNLSGTAANYEFVENLLQGIPARNKLLLMDTCESGEIEENIRERYNIGAKNGKFIPRTGRGIKIVSVENVKEKGGGNRVYLYERGRFIYNDLIRRSGAIVFSSSKGGEFSYESEHLKNGFFTAEFLNAFNNGKADLNKDGLISTDELREYVAIAVDKLSNGLQHPTVDRDNIYQKFGFPY